MQNKIPSCGNSALVLLEAILIMFAENWFEEVPTVSICSDGHDVLDQLAVGHKTFPCKLVSPHFCPFIYQMSEEATYFKNLLMLFTYFLSGSCKIHT